MSILSVGEMMSRRSCDSADPDEGTDGGEETLIKSAPRVFAWKGIFKKPCTASVWKMASGHSLWVSFAI